MNALSPTETLTNLNWDLNLVTLTTDKIKLLNYLEKETKLSKESFLNKIINGKSEWIDLEDLKDILERKKSPNLKFYSGEEGLNYLRSLYLNKQTHLNDL